jgi:general stress protein YciG
MSDDKKDLKDGEHKAEASTDPRSTGASTPPESQTQAVSTDSDGRGFASMDGDKQREIASKGGKAAHEKGTAHEFSAEEARAAGKRGGQAVSQNRAHMAAIGRKGGQRVSQNRAHMASIGRRGGEAVSGDRAHMAQIGRKGGESRGDKQQRARRAQQEKAQQPPAPTEPQKAPEQAEAALDDNRRPAKNDTSPLKWTG